jgi:hypothetical protein
MKKLVISAAAIALAVPGAFAQEAPTTSSSAGSPTTGDVSTQTSGSATGTPDSVEVTGTADAQASDGGTAQAESTAKFNRNMANQRSTATASDDDERARSMTRSHATRHGADTSHSTSIYKKKGEKPVVEHEHSVTTPREKDAATGSD